MKKVLVLLALVCNVFLVASLFAQNASWDESQNMVFEYKAGAAKEVVIDDASDVAWTTLSWTNSSWDQEEVVKMPAMDTLNQKLLNSAEAIGSITIEYCDLQENQKVLNKKELFIESEAGNKEKICFSLTNLSNDTVQFWVNFVDGLFNNMWNKSCDIETATGLFGQYVTWFTKMITISGGATTRLVTTVQFPKGTVGRRLGCLTLRPWIDIISEQTSSWSQGWGMKIIARRWMAIEVFNKWMLDRLLFFTSELIQWYGKNILKTPELTIDREVGDYVTIWFRAVNSGQVTETIKVVGSVTDALGNVVELPEVVKKISEWRSELIVHKMLVPWYKFWFTVKYDIQETPDLLNIPKEFVRDGWAIKNVQLSATFFLFPRRLVIAMATLIALIIITKKIRKKMKQRKLERLEKEKEYNNRKLAQDAKAQAKEENQL